MAHFEIMDNRRHGEQVLAASTQEASSRMAFEIYSGAPGCDRKLPVAIGGTDWLPTIHMSEADRKELLRDHFKEKAKECQWLAQEQARAQEQKVDLDAIDPAQLDQAAQFGGPVGNWFRYLGRASWHAIDGMARPGATDNLIFGSIVRAEHYYADHSFPAIGNDIGDLFHDATRALTHAPEALEKMTAAQKSKASAELVLNAFFLLGAKTPVACEKAEQLGLKYMSKEQLNNLGFEQCDVPKLQVACDEFSMQTCIPGDSKAFVRIEVPSPGVVDVTSIDKGSLRDGMGGDLLAESLKDFGQRPTKRLCFSGIINKPTQEAFAAGVDPADSVLGRTGRRALELFGLEAKGYRFEQVNGKLNLVIDVE